MFGHDDVAHNHEPVFLPRLFQNREETVAAACAAQKRQSPIAGAGDKVQVMSAVGAMQADGHNKPDGNKQHRTRPCKKRKDGAPAVLERERTTVEGWATRLYIYPGYAHSPGTTNLGFSKPSVLDQGVVPTQVIFLLNKPWLSSIYSYYVLLTP